jgi:hypothetical protein
VAKRYNPNAYPIEGLLGKTVGPLCVVRKAQMEMDALNKADPMRADPAANRRRQLLAGCQHFMISHGIALGSTSADAWLLMQSFDIVSFCIRKAPPIKRLHTLFDRMRAIEDSQINAVLKAKVAAWLRQLMLALRFLLIHGLNWGDISGENIMIRCFSLTVFGEHR